MLDYATTRLSTEFETKIEIGSIDYRFFNTLALEDVYIEDQQQDTLLFVEELNANFEFWKFFKNKLVFSQLEFDGLRGHIKSDGQGNTNLDFFFKNLDKEKESAFIDLKLEKFKIKNSYLSYNNLSDSTETLLFNPNHIHLSRLNTEINVREFNKDSININIRYLNAQESSGLKLENLSLKAYGSPRGITIPEFSIELPESKIKLSPASMKFDSYEDFNDFANKIIFEIPVKEATLSFHDLAAFVPGFRGLHEIIKVDALLTGRLASLRLQNMKVEYGKSFQFDADLDVNGLPNLEESFFYGTVNQLQINKTELEDLVARIDNRPFVLPKEFNQLGLISYRGNITGFLSDLVAYGNLNTNIGSISSDISIKFQNQLQDISYNGRLRTNNLALGKFFNDTIVGKIAIDLNTTGTKLMHQPFKGTLTARVAELEFNKYNYKNATFDGEYDGSGFNGQILIDDENINADFYGIIDFRNPKVPVFDFNLELNNTNLYALNLIPEYPDSRISFKGNTNMSGSSFDNLNGTLQFSDIVFSNKGRTLNGNEILFTSRTGANNTNVQIQSDFVNGSFSGDFKYSSIGNTFRKVLSRYLPSLATNGKKNGNGNNYLPNNIHVDLTFDNLQEIAQVFYLPYEIEGTTTIRGDIDEANNEIELISNISNIKTTKQIFENITIRLENQGQQLQLTGRTQMHDINSGLMNVFFSANAARDKLLAKLIWQNNKEITNAGEIDTETLFSRTDEAISAHTRFNPTQIIITDSVWDIRSSDVFFSSDSMITIDNFLFDNGRQFFHIDGVASSNRSDSVTVSMNDLNLDYIMELIRLDGISFSGVTTGKLQLFSLLKEPIFLADLAVKDFKLNDHIMGNAWVKTSWDKSNSQLLIDGFLTNDELDILADVNGVFIPGADSLELNIESRELSTGFLNRYFEGVASKVDGKGEGWVHIYGPLKDIKIEADVFVTDGSATIDMLNTVYHFNDRVVLTTDKIIIDNITLFDEENNPARATGVISHDGSFNNMLYDVKINAGNILAMNTRPGDDEFFYGKAYIGGLVHIFGNEEEANIVVNGVTRPKTSCYMSMGSTSSVLENDFIRFIEKTVENYKSDFDEEEPLEFVSSREFNVKVDMQIEVTPEAVMEILVDPNGGDKITGRGRGNIRILFDTFSDVEIYGTVELEQGSYLFTLQTVIRKEFKINEGSTISFAGDPFEAQANINGYYGLTASLTDLIEREELQQITSRSTVPVHCLMYLTEDMMAPTIRFDIDLPSSDESLKSRVRNVINTDEMMNRQILYLLLFHKFFTPDDIRATSTNFAISEGISFATATLSSQFNRWIQNSMNTDIISLGFDWQKADAVSDEFKAQILIQPNNRLVINGNIGYRNDDISEENWFGDFDLEYKLIESGKLRFTAYNHSIDRAQLREARTTQGVGLIYREDFNNLREMIDYYWNAIRGIFTPKPKKEEANL